jgi:hypothetical protein
VTAAQGRAMTDVRVDSRPAMRLLGRARVRYFVPVPSPIAACAAARRATGTRNGLHDT